jgi:hypothetical protein
MNDDREMERKDREGRVDMRKQQPQFFVSSQPVPRALWPYAVLLIDLLLFRLVC